jgi:hypothetical protein
VGVKFRADTPGTVTGVRFYKLPTNTSPHTGALWSSSGALLASATFAAETASGWQQVTFSSPVAISANTTYVASYHTIGRYAADRNYFGSTGVDRVPVHGLANGVDGGNGVYMYGANTAFPTNSYSASNYWVDVVFNPAAPPASPTPTATATTTPTPTSIPSGCPCTIFPSSATPAPGSGGDTNSVEVGLKFRADTSGTITGIRFYKLSVNSGPHVGSVWTSTGTLLASAAFAAETASGWQQATFSSPVAITANTTYVASYHTNGHYASDPNYFRSRGVDAAPLHALANGIDGGNGVYMYGANPAFPTNTYSSSSYWVDVVFAP